MRDLNTDWRIAILPDALDTRSAKDYRTRIQELVLFLVLVLVLVRHT